MQLLSGDFMNKCRIKSSRLVLLIMLLSIISGCNKSLDIENTNEPDRERVLSDPDAVMALVGDSYYHIF